VEVIYPLYSTAGEDGGRTYPFRNRIAVMRRKTPREGMSGTEIYSLFEQWQRYSRVVSRDNPDKRSRKKAGVGVARIDRER
jgi:hypothetical protein